MAEEVPLQKKVIKSILDLLILHLLKNNSFSNNQIAEEINEQFEVYINPATIHIALIRLKNDKFIKQIAREIYKLTQKGEQMRVQIGRNYLCLQKSIEQQLRRYY